MTTIANQIRRALTNDQEDTFYEALENNISFAPTMRLVNTFKLEEKLEDSILDWAAAAHFNRVSSL